MLWVGRVLTESTLDCHILTRFTSVTIVVQRNRSYKSSNLYSHVYWWCLICSQCHAFLSVPGGQWRGSCWRMGQRSGPRLFCQMPPQRSLSWISYRRLDDQVYTIPVDHLGNLGMRLSWVWSGNETELDTVWEWDWTGYSLGMGFNLSSYGLSHTRFIL